MPRHDVAIYSPPSAYVLRRSVGRSGGAERQMALLAAELACLGRRVAVVVYPVPDPGPEIEGRLTLVERAPHSGFGVRGVLLEAVRVARALWRADARVVVVRGGRSVVGVIGLYCWLLRRKLIFSSASDRDFLDRAERRGHRGNLYRLGVRQADAVVVQSRRQIELARHAFPKTPASRLVRIPSFASRLDLQAGGPPNAFFWVGRLHHVKRPLMYAELAATIPDATFVLVPLIPPTLTEEQSDLLARLESAAADLPNLVVEPPTPHAALMGRLARAVAVVNTSLHEGMPNTFLEAWSLGIPALTLSFDPDDVVRERGLGISAGGSWERFVAGARELWEERLERSDLSTRVRAYVREAHSPANVARQWDALLETLGPPARPDRVPQTIHRA